jgi:hypothetical protein
MAISENNSSSAELNAKNLETQIISQQYEPNICVLISKKGILSHSIVYIHVRAPEYISVITFLFKLHLNFINKTLMCCNIGEILLNIEQYQLNKLGRHGFITNKRVNV